MTVLELIKELSKFPYNCEVVAAPRDLDGYYLVIMAERMKRASILGFEAPETPAVNLILERW